MIGWSKYQNDIFEYATDDSNGSFVVAAVAGSGKTTTAVECAKRIAENSPEKNILFLAFNKTIVEKLKEETESIKNMKCQTLHSFGMSVLCKSNMKFSVNVNKWKQYINKNYTKLVDKELPENKEWLYKTNCEKLLTMCRINMTCENESEILDVANKYNISIVANEIHTVSKLIKKSGKLINFKTPSGYEIDFTDMLCLPLTDAFRKFIFKYDVVFIDEAQDLSRVQQELMTQIVSKTGKFIAIGDKSQSINGFAGADENSFKRLVRIAGKILPLSVNYRCGKNIINEAKKYVKEIEAFEDSPDGEILHRIDLKDANAGDMVICRKTAPLISVALNFIANGKSAFIKGKDIAEDMKMLLNKVDNGKDNGIGLENLFSKLEKQVDDMKEFLINQGAYNVFSHPAYINICDKVESIKIIAKNCENLHEIYELLDKIFTDTINGDAIILSTVHKAKGLENDNVFIICPEILPMTFPKQQEWEFEQEMNLKYVAVTRAKNKLVFVDVPEKQINEIKVV
jgi:superfamily I DNA/RNA helicase